MNSIYELLQYQFIGNTLEKYLWFVSIIFLGIIFRRFISKLSSKFLYRLFKRYSNEISAENFFSILHKPFKSLIMLIFFYLAINQLKFPAEWDLAPKHEFGIRMLFGKGYQVIFFSVFIWIVLKLVDIIGEILKKKAERSETKTNDQIVSFIIDALKVVVVILGIFIILGTVLSINIGSLIAGLGIGGLAIALAAKETLENLLGSFTIFLDKPFVQGDLVKVHEISGVVEKVGFRSTRIRTLEKTYVTIPNKRMIDAELDNISLRTYQRAKFNFELAYETPVEKVKLITKETCEFLENHPLINSDYLVKLIELGSNSIVIQVMFFINSNDYNLFLNIKEETNYTIIDLVSKHQAKFASPLSTMLPEKVKLD